MALALPDSLFCQSRLLDGEETEYLGADGGVIVESSE